MFRKPDEYIIKSAAIMVEEDGLFDDLLDKPAGPGRKVGSPIKTKNNKKKRGIKKKS